MHTPTTARPELTAVVTEVLGDLAFMISDAQPDEPVAGTVWMQAEVHYDGPVGGTLRCWCTRTFATRLAANLLGIEAEEGCAQVAAEDALRELMNVLCGQLVTRWHGSNDVFDLSIPDVQECTAGPPAPGGEREPACRLSVEGEPLFCCYASDR